MIETLGYRDPHLWPTPGCAMERGVGLWGPGGAAAVGSLQECQGVCADSPGCQAWLYRPAMDTCYLKESSCDRRVLEGGWSGTRGCGHPGAFLRLKSTLLHGGVKNGI